MPIPTALSEPFWQGCAEGELRYQHCTQCGAAVFKPQSHCPQCLSERLTWRAGSGIGVVYSFSVVWRPQTPAFEVPYVVAIIELSEGYHMMSNIVDCDASSVHCGMPVEATFTRMPEGMVLPFFKPRCGGPPTGTATAESPEGSPG
ncbi:Zn-ribbon domain-containing OB-fold protein [Saccharopolyspora sp. NPDC050642]|uniref:Zn-ribbon domain-containing OB-fold protein n=1 Tax=Saccharopolyspora sp. NPDC050642 TaxID=3157099 RepID=UPI0033CCA731